MSKRRSRAPRPSRPPSATAAMVDRPSPRLQAAGLLWNKGRASDAVALFEEAIRQEPNNVQSYVAAARAFAGRFEFDRMEETLERLVRRAPAHPGVHHYLGEAFSQLKLPQRALASYERAASLPGAGPPTWMELASLYERAHRLDDAEEMIERAIGSGYELPLVWLLRGRIHRRKKRLTEAEAAFRQAIDRSGQHVDWACEAWGELALMKDAQDDPAAALEAIERCKGLQRSRAAPHTAVSAKAMHILRELIGAANGADFRRWRDELGELPPQRVALLTGFPRSGTTLLEQVLDAHPGLVSSEERDFIGNELVRTFTYNRPNKPLMEVFNELTPAQIEPQRQRYFRSMEYLLGEPIAGRLHLDKNPAYNLTIPLLLRMFPEARLIVAVRDPRDVVLSCYLRYLPLNAVSVEFLDVKRAAERYALDMAGWLKFRDLIDVPWVQIRYEDAVADVETQTRRALQALDLPWDPAVLDYRRRLGETRQVTSPSYEAVAQPIYTRAVGRWKKYERALAPAIPILAPFLREFGYE